MKALTRDIEGLFNGNVKKHNFDCNAHKFVAYLQDEIFFNIHDKSQVVLTLLEEGRIKEATKLAKFLKDTIENLLLAINKHYKALE